MDLTIIAKNCNYIETTLKRDPSSILTIVAICENPPGEIRSTFSVAVDHMERNLLTSAFCVKSEQASLIQIR